MLLHVGKRRAPDEQRANRAADKNERQNAADVSKKLSTFQAVAGVEDDGWQEEIEENFGRKRRLNEARNVERSAAGSRRPTLRTFLSICCVSFWFVSEYWPSTIS